MAFPGLLFIGRIVAYCAKFLGFLAPLAIWLNKTWQWFTNKVLIAYFGSRIWVTVTLIAFAVGLVAIGAELTSIFASALGEYAFEQLPQLPNDSINFLLNYITFDWIFELLSYFFGAFVTYIVAVKSLWIFKQSLNLFRYVSKAVK